MHHHRILTMQDISCVGQCSMTVALPILTLCGMETCILPSAILSTHTGGFGTPAIQGLEAFVPNAMTHWKAQGLSFEAFYTGYLGNLTLVQQAMELAREISSTGGRVVVDPAMADHGKLYSGFDEPYVRAMAQLCGQAHVILPNLTEACLLTGTDYPQVYDEAFICTLLEKLHGLGAESIVLTGIGYQPGHTGVVVSQKGKLYHYEHSLLPRSYHGTGDIYAAAFVGCWLGGRSMEEAAAIAADFAGDCIRVTLDDPDYWYGTKLHCALPLLAHRLCRQ